MESLLANLARYTVVNVMCDFGIAKGVPAKSFQAFTTSVVEETLAEST